MSRLYRVSLTNTIGKSILTAILIFTCSQAFSQTLSNSPYSRFGLGELQNPGFAQNVALGGGGYGWRCDTFTPSYINVVNPASFSSFRLTTIEMGLLSNTTQFETTDQKFKLNNTSFGYISVGLPVSKHWGLAFGVMPYTTVGYKISDSQAKDTLGRVNYNYEGTGGLNRVYLGNGFKLLGTKYAERTGVDLSAGVNASYIFGSINNIRRVTFNDPNYFNTRVDQNIRVHDVSAEAGVQLSFPVHYAKHHRTLNPELKTCCAQLDAKRKDTVDVFINCKVDSVHYRGLFKKKQYCHNANDSVKYEPKFLHSKTEEQLRVTFGFTFTPEMGLRASTDLLARSYAQPGLYEVYRDTLIKQVNQPTTAHIPARFGAGISISNSYRWNILADYSFQQWSGYRLGDQNGGLKNSMQGSLGFQFQPAQRGRYWEIARYRLGARYNQTYLEIQSTQIVEYGFTFGAAFPVAVSRVKKHGYDVSNRYYSMVNISAELGQRGTTSNGLIRETYARVVLGFTINDRWFQRFKYND